MITDQQKDLIDEFFTNVVNGYTNDEIDNFINDETNKAVIDNFTLTSKEIEDIVLNCHIKACKSVAGKGVSPYTSVSSDFSINNLERRVSTIAPKFVDVVRNVERRYVDFNVMFDALKQSLQNTAVNVITESASKEATNKVIIFAKEAVEKEVREKVKKAAQEAADEASKHITERAKKVISAARKSVNTASQSAKRALRIANVAAAKVAKIVSEVKPDLAKTAAETTVTVLSIFAAIVVTIISGLVFSNSVFQNMNDASAFRLALTTSLVGIICLNMIVYMIRYISKIGVTDELIPAWKKVWGKHDNIIIGINVFLGVLVAISFVLTCVFDFNPKGSNSISNDSNDSISVNVAVDGNKSSLQSSNKPDGEVTDISTVADITTDSETEPDNLSVSESYDNPDTGDKCS